MLNVSVLGLNSLSPRKWVTPRKMIEGRSFQCVLSSKSRRVLVESRGRMRAPFPIHALDRTRLRHYPKRLLVVGTNRDMGAKQTLTLPSTFPAKSPGPQANTNASAHDNPIHRRHSVPPRSRLPFEPSTIAQPAPENPGIIELHHVTATKPSKASIGSSPASTQNPRPPAIDQHRRSAPRPTGPPRSPLPPDPAARILISRQGPAISSRPAYAAKTRDLHCRAQLAPPR